MKRTTAAKVGTSWDLNLGLPHQKEGNNHYSMQPAAIFTPLRGTWSAGAFAATLHFGDSSVAAIPGVGEDDRE